MKNDINQDKSTVLALGMSLRNCKDEERADIIEKIASFFIKGQHHDNMQIMSVIHTTTWLNDRAFNLIVENLQYSYDIPWLLARTKRKDERHPQMMARYQTLLEQEFANSNFRNKLEMFHELTLHHSPHNADIIAANHAFCQKHWQDLVWLIDSVEKGEAVHHALLGVLGINRWCREIWATVAALKTMEIWAKDKSAEDMANNYQDFLDKFALEDSPLKVIIAQEIFKKM